MSRLLPALILAGQFGLATASPLSADKVTDMRGAIDDLTAALTNNDFQLVKVQPVDQALVKRGYRDPGVRIVFVGKAEQVAQAIASDPALLNLLPLRLVLEQEGDRVRVVADDLDPWRLMNPASGPVLDRWERDLARILRDYAEGQDFASALP